MKKFRISLLWQVLIAIAAGIALGQFLPVPVARIFVAHYHWTDYPGHFRFGERRGTVVARHGGHRLRFHHIFGILHLFQWKSCFP